MLPLTVLVLLASILSFITPGLFELLVYDRSLIQQGEWWRFVSGHFTHFTFEHLFLNCLLFGAFSFVLERQSASLYYILMPILILVMGVFQWFFLPDMVRYAGLSGLLSGIAGFLIMLEINKQVKVKIQWYLLFSGLVLKIVYEFITGKTYFIKGQEEVFQVVPEIHAVSLLSAALFFVVVKKVVKPLYYKN